MPSALTPCKTLIISTNEKGTTCADKLLAPAADEEAPEPEDKTEEVEIHEEAEPLTVAKDPKMPSPAEVAEHNITHWPFRSWCKFCNMGRGLGEQRGRHAGRTHTIPRVGIDYWYITSEGLKLRNELSHQETTEGT